MSSTPKTWASVAAVALAAATVAASSAFAQGLKSYDSTKKEFWEHPPADWFLGDETPADDVTLIVVKVL